MTSYRTALLAAAVVAIGMSGPAGAGDIAGAGATFPYPIYAKWAEAYKAKTGTAMNYQSIGSGGGIKQITAKTVDFGASDMPLKPDALAKDGLVQWPQVMGGVVSRSTCRISRPACSTADPRQHLLGRRKWNDKAIALNPGSNAR